MSPDEAEAVEAEDQDASRPRRRQSQHQHAVRVEQARSECWRSPVVCLGGMHTQYLTAASERSCMAGAFDLGLVLIQTRTPKTRRLVVRAGLTRWRGLEVAATPPCHTQHKPPQHPPHLALFEPCRLSLRRRDAKMEMFHRHHSDPPLPRPASGARLLGRGGRMMAMEHLYLCISTSQRESAGFK